MNRNRGSGGPRRRIFTREEDELILSNVHGHISHDKLKKTLKCGDETLFRRASELGLQIKKNPPTMQNRVKSKPRIVKDKNGEVIFHDAPHVGKDLLLRRLHAVCGERRYNSGDE